MIVQDQNGVSPLLRLLREHILQESSSMKSSLDWRSTEHILHALAAHEDALRYRKMEGSDDGNDAEQSEAEGKGDDHQQQQNLPSERELGFRAALHASCPNAPPELLHLLYTYNPSVMTNLTTVHAPMFDQLALKPGQKWTDARTQLIGSEDPSLDTVDMVHRPKEVRQMFLERIGQLQELERATFSLVSTRTCSNGYV